MQIRNNALLKPEKPDADWSALTGDDLDKCVVKGNRTIPFPTDTRAPATPMGLVAVKRLGAVELRWKRNTEIDVVGYRVHKNGKPVKGPMRCAPFWVDLAVTPGVEITYAVSAVDLSGNESKPSVAIAVTPAW